MFTSNRSDSSICEAKLLTKPQTFSFLCHYTFFVILEGCLDLNSDTISLCLNSNDIYFVDQICDIHGYLRSDSKVLIVSFSPAFLSPYIPGYPAKITVNSVLSPSQNYRSLLQLLLELSYYYFTDNTDLHHIIICAHKILIELKEHFTSVTDVPAECSGNSDRISNITQYISENYRHSITQADMARHLYLSPQHCSRLFKQYFHMTFLEYLNYVRLQHVLEDFQHTDQSITQIAYENGFPNLTSFHRVFKKHLHVTPSKYRMQYLTLEHSGEFNAHPEETSLSLQNVEQYMQQLQISLQAQEDSAHFETLVFSTQTSGNIFPSWNSILNIGLLSNCLTHKFHIQLSDLQHQLHYRYIRFHGLLDDTIMPLIPHTQKLNFQNIDTVFDFFKELCLTPFIEIESSSMSLDRLQPFLRHCIHRYGIQAMQDWHFEICLDSSDLLSNGYEDETLFSQYVTHYRACSAFIKSLMPQAKVGGPAFHAVVSPSIFNNFLQKIASENLQLDFISICLFPYIFPESSSEKNFSEDTVILGDEQLMYNRAIKICSVLKRSAYKNTNLFVSEYFFSVSPRNHLNDSCFQAAFILKTLLELPDCFAGFGYYRSLDISEYYSDISTPLYGGPGLITKDNIMKPSYYAHQFLNYMRGELIEKGDGYILTRTAPNNYALLLYYYVHPVSSFLLQVEEEHSPLFSEKFFPKCAKKSFDITLNALQSASYLVRQYVLSQKHGSVLDAWIRLGTASYLSVSDIQYLRNISVPQRSMSTVHTNHSALSFSVGLSPFEIKYIEIMPVPST